MQKALSISCSQGPSPSPRSSPSFPSSRGLSENNLPSFVIPSTAFGVLNALAGSHLVDSWLSTLLQPAQRLPKSLFTTGTTGVFRRRQSGEPRVCPERFHQQALAPNSIRPAR
ncbi:hypothetical protein CCMA1212_006348 [Trichoderma ghanense]|uniref:Uncharacterized protein n=1 Tax=Trichoderma ghanense TaxID=65468 RepID=A0ABY2H0Y1_9HYPO